MTFALAIDGLIIILLLITIGYAALLARRLSALRAAKAEMEALLKGFGQAAADAERAMQAIDRDGRGTAETLERLTAEARGITDDLTFLVDRGNKLADRLSADSSGPVQEATGGDRAARAGHEPDRAEPVPSARAALLKSIEGMR